MSFEGRESAEKSPVQSKVESMIFAAASLEEVAEKLKGIAFVVETLPDPDTGNDLDTERVASAVKSGDPTILSDEAPVWLIKALSKSGLIA